MSLLRLPSQPTPLALERLIAQMVSKDMSKRPASMTVVKQELQRITDQGRTGQLSPGILLCTYRGHSGAVATLAWSPDGTRIASASDDKTVQVWQAPGFSEASPL